MNKKVSKFMMKFQPPKDKLKIETQRFTKLTEILRQLEKLMNNSVERLNL